MFILRRHVYSKELFLSTVSNNIFLFPYSYDATGQPGSPGPLVDHHTPPDDVVGPRQADQLVHHVDLCPALAVRLQVAQVPNLTHLALSLDRRNRDNY